jgi:hypothetical protein
VDTSVDAVIVIASTVRQGVSIMCSELYIYQCISRRWFFDSLDLVIWADGSVKQSLFAAFEGTRLLRLRMLHLDAIC